MTNPADSFFGDSAKSAKFDSIGDMVGGPIVSIGEARQQTDFSTGTPLTWQDGSPRMQLPVTVQTNLRDAGDPNDDGKRTFYIKGEMKKAIGLALRAASAKMAVGGVLTLTYSDNEPTQGFPKKLYTASYQPPAPDAGFFSPEHGAAAAPTVAQPVQTYQQQVTPQPQPVYQQPAAAPQPVAQAPAQPQYTPEQMAAMQAAYAAQQAAQAAAQAAPDPQKASYEQYAAAMGFTPPTERAPF